MKFKNIHPWNLNPPGAIRIVLQYTKNYRLPEPICLAHHLSKISVKKISND